jgi:hypothetical protein
MSVGGERLVPLRPHTPHHALSRFGGARDYFVSS